MSETTKTPRETGDLAAGAARIVRSLGRRICQEDPADLLYLVELEQAARSALDAAVLAQRERGATDGQIAEALGVSRQAVSKRWPGGGRYRGAAGRYRPSAPS